MAASSTRRFVTAALIAAAAVVMYLVMTSGGGHRFWVVVPAADNLVPGNRISAGTRPIGIVTSVEPVDRGRAARINIEIDDSRYWPLSTASRLALRFGGTVSFVNRYILLEPGSPGGATIPDGGELPRRNVTVPVELDTVISKLTPPVREGVRRLIASGAANMDRAASDLRTALPATPPVLSTATGVLADLTSNQQQLSALVSSTGHVVNVVDQSSPGLRTLLDGLAQTLDAVASKQSQLQVTLARLPGALRQTRSTLTNADVTLRDAVVLTDRLAPGVVSLRRVAQPLDNVLGTLSAVTPPARQTLDAIAQSGPTSEALGRLASVTPQIGSISRQATTQLGCIRPYTPEVVEFGTTWGDWMSMVDSRDHLVRAQIQSFLPANFNSEPFTPEQLVKTYPGIEYGFPRPPGEIAGQPWFQPQCGAGPDALDPSKDQEAAHAANLPVPPALVPSASITGGRR
jgi:ABC-type transporter Mla subunit MlaD